MRKFICVLLAVALVIGLFAGCNILPTSRGDNSVEKLRKDIVGEWYCVENDRVMVFTEDGWGVSKLVGGTEEIA